MCDRCSQLAAPTINALEALANGEPIPEVPDAPNTMGVASVPLMIGQFSDDRYAFVTNAEGYELISRILRATGLMVPMDDDES